MTVGHPADPPAFLVSASLHRSGSTLLQRYLTAATDAFIWGENGRLIQAWREAYESWPSEPHDVEAYHRAMDTPAIVERTFLPNLSPPRERLLDGLRESFSHLYATHPPGFTRWGWKEVGYGERDIAFIRTLFPDIRIVLLVRNPWAVARSIRRKGWIDRRGYFSDMEEVAQIWTVRSAEYRRLADSGDKGVHLVQYEQMDRDLDALNDFLGVDGRGAWDRICRKKLGTAPVWSRFDFTDDDKETVGRIAGQVAADFGYEGPGRLAANAELVGP